MRYRNGYRCLLFGREQFGVQGMRGAQQRFQILAARVVLVGGASLILWKVQSAVDGAGIRVDAGNEAFHPFPTLEIPIAFGAEIVADGGVDVDKVIACYGTAVNFALQPFDVDFLQVADFIPHFLSFGYLKQGFKLCLVGFIPAFSENGLFRCRSVCCSPPSK